MFSVILGWFFAFERALWHVLFVKKTQKFLENFRPISKNKIVRVDLSSALVALQEPFKRSK